MTIQYVYYGEIKEDKMEAWIKWWRNEENVRKFKETMTEGMTLKGIYVAISGTASYDYEMWVELDNWGVLDKDRENQRQAALFREFIQEHGIVDKWQRTRAFRTVHDVKSPIMDI
ncbi:MAG: hypothetical protein ACW99A_03460 [Candidatus Kariarchaeaceae archaeon]|jgi:hypothetical protein